MLEFGPLLSLLDPLVHAAVELCTGKNPNIQHEHYYNIIRCSNLGCIFPLSVQIISYYFPQRCPKLCHCVYEIWITSIRWTAPYSYFPLSYIMYPSRHSEYKKSLMLLTFLTTQPYLCARHPIFHKTLVQNEWVNEFHSGTEQKASF